MWTCGHVCIRTATIMFTFNDTIKKRLTLCMGFVQMSAQVKL